jgi:hypothetical protein
MEEGYCEKPPEATTEPSPAAAKKRKRAAAGETVNALGDEQIEAMIQTMRQKGKLVPVRRGDRCFEKSMYKTTGPNKHGQVDLAPVGRRGKALVHHIYWRYKNGYRPLPDDLPISHLDAEPEVLHLTAESVQMNESRKYCHLFKWYKAKPGEDHPRCPHREEPCTGPS